jgi:hypothetical protein
MKKLLIKLGLFNKTEMTLDEYIISIRPTTVKLSCTVIRTNSQQGNNKRDDGPEEAGCLVTA